MKLSTDIIYEELEKYFDIRLEGTRTSKLYLRSVYFYSKDCPVRKDSIYITDNDAIPEKSAGLVICMKDGTSPGIHFLSEENIFNVFNAVQSVFDKYNAWDAQLSTLLLEQAGVEQMLLVSAPIIRNPMVALNSHMEIVGAVGYDENRNEKWYLNDIKNIPIEYANRMRITRNETNKNQDFFTYNDEGANAVWGVNLIAHGEYNGSLSMTEECTKFTPGRFELLKHLKKYIEEEIFHRAYAKQTYITPVKTALSSLLSGGTGNEQQIEKNILNFFEIETTVNSWLEIVIMPDPGAKLAVPEYLINAIDDLFLNGISFLYDDNIVCLICNPNEDNVKTALNRMLEPMKTINMSVGVSNLFFSLEDFITGYKQAICAIETGRYMGIKDDIFLFSEYLLHYILQNAKGTFNITDIMTSGIKQLIEHDRQKEVSYIETLRCFLENNMNISATAKALYLHRSSLEQRLERIYAMLGSKLEKADERLYYCLILRMMKEEDLYIL